MDREWKTVSGHLLKLHRDKKGTESKNVVTRYIDPTNSYKRDFFQKRIINYSFYFIILYFICFDRLSMPIIH